MCKYTYSPLWSLAVAAFVTCMLCSMGVSLPQAVAQDESTFSSIEFPAMMEESGTANAGNPGVEETAFMAEPPMLTPEMQAHLKYWSEHTNLPGPVLGGAAPLGMGPEQETESDIVRPRSNEPLLPGTPTLFRNVAFGSIIPSGYKSNVMESSTAVAGKYAFFTGNWFAARSTNSGSTWTYINAFTGFPAYSPFCCDQVTIYNESRNRFFWLRMGSPGTNPTSGNYENVFKLGVSSDGGANFCTYTFAPTNTNSTWTNQWWDYPHIQIGADYLYLAWNMFNNAGSWTRTVMLRLPLDSLATCAGFSYNYYYNSSWFTFVPVQGANHTMYWASNWPTTTPQNSRLAIWKWNEDTTSISSVVKNTAAWSVTGRGDAVCGATTGNWAARYDQRVLTGARYEINATNLKYSGRKVLGWWWNVKQGGNFARPYIEAAAFFEDTLNQVAGLQGRPYVWNSSTCFAYPSATPNKRGDLGIVLNYSSGTALNPSVAYGIADDFVTAPPGYSIFNVRTSLARPADNKWGDYNTVREFEPTQKVWAGASHYLPTTSGTCCSASAPFFFIFGRERDTASWTRWIPY